MYTYCTRLLDKHYPVVTGAHAVQTSWRACACSVCCHQHSLHHAATHAVHPASDMVCAGYQQTGSACGFLGRTVCIDADYSTSSMKSSWCVCSRHLACVIPTAQRVELLRHASELFFISSHDVTRSSQRMYGVWNGRCWLVLRGIGTALQNNTRIWRRRTRHQSAGL